MLGRSRSGVPGGPCGNWVLVSPAYKLPHSCIWHVLGTRSRTCRAQPWGLVADRKCSWLGARPCAAGGPNTEAALELTQRPVGGGTACAGGLRGPDL